MLVGAYRIVNFRGPLMKNSMLLFQRNSDEKVGEGDDSNHVLTACYAVSLSNVYVCVYNT